MTKARDIANLVDSNGDVVSGALDNVPASDNASALTTGTLPDGRFPATLPASSGANLTALPAANLTGTIATARLGTGSASNGNFLRGDGSWQVAGSTNASDLTSGTLNSVRLPAGTILQVVVAETSNQVIVGNSTTKIIEGSFTTKQANSKLFASVNLAIGGFNAYTDRDIALALAFKTGSPTTTSSDYTSMNSSTFTRQGISGLNTYFCSDTMRGGSNGDNYWSETKSHSVIVDTSIAAGTTVNVANWCSTDGKYLFGVGASRENSYSDSGSEMSLTIMEVAT